MTSSRRKGETSEYFQDGRVRSGVYFSLVLAEVMVSAAFLASPDWAIRVFFALTCSYHGQANGNISLTFEEAQKYGITSEWKLRAGLAVLERTGLIECMRRGHIQNGKGVCSLFALGFRQIDPSDGYDQPLTMAVRAPNRWAKWIRPADWDDQVTQLRLAAQGKRSKWSSDKATKLTGASHHTREEQDKKTSHHTREDYTATHVRSETASPRHTRREQETRFPTTHVGGTSQSLGPTSPTALPVHIHATALLRGLSPRFNCSIPLRLGAAVRRAHDA